MAESGESENDVSPLVTRYSTESREFLMDWLQFVERKSVERNSPKMVQPQEPGKHVSPFTSLLLLRDQILWLNINVLMKVSAHSLL